MTRPTDFIPAAHNPRFARFFGWYNRRLLSKSFHSVAIQTETLPLARELAAEPGPVIIAMTHASWWDPLSALLVGETLLKGRSGIAPMEAAQLRKFLFFRKLGIFGITPDDPASLSRMLGYVKDFLETSPRPTLVITPQGRFADPRDTPSLRPGTAAILASLTACRAVVLAIEYPFWQDKKPELLMRMEEVHAPTPLSTTTWQRALVRTMGSCAEALASAVIARDPAPFTTLLSHRSGSVNPVYDLILRIRGQTGRVVPRTQNSLQRGAP